MGECDADDIRKSIQAVGKIINIFCTPRAFKSVITPIYKKNFPICHPHAKTLLHAILFQTDTKIDYFIYDFVVIPHLEDDVVHPNYQVNRIKGAVMSFLGDLVCPSL